MPFYVQIPRDSLLTFVVPKRRKWPILDQKNARFPCENANFQKTFRYLLRFYSLLFRGFFVVFSWLFRGPLLSRGTVFGPFSLPFRGFFVAFSWPLFWANFYAYSPWNSLLKFATLRLFHAYTPPPRPFETPPFGGP